MKLSCSTSIESKGRGAKEETRRKFDLGLLRLYYRNPLQQIFFLFVLVFYLP
jgi:hypothetical protein